MKKPTVQAYSELQDAYDHFNSELFNDTLPCCMIILYNKERRTFGYFSPEQFVNHDGEKADTIAMNPQYFAGRSLEYIMQTLVHEMAHLWQHHLGTQKSLRAYHNKEWGDMMESIGLMPSNTGKPGGKKTGQQMMDYVLEGGKFKKACERLLTQKFRISWMDRFPVLKDECELDLSALALLGLGSDSEESEGGETQKPNKTNRVKYSCETCKINIWGKPNLNVVCGECGATFTAS